MSSTKSGAVENPPRRALVILAGAMAAHGVVLSLLLATSNSVTKANLGRIAVGMPRDEVRAMLGRPEYEAADMGVVGEDGAYATNVGQTPEEMERRGGRKCRQEQWSSAEITIVAVFGPDGRVVGKCSAPGRPSNWLACVRSMLPF